MDPCNITIHETCHEDLENTMQLWNDGDVMKFVGFPNGLGTTLPRMEHWLMGIEQARPRCNHYSIYAKGFGYCGETFYSIDQAHGNAAAMDIKLFQKARGCGIASQALSFAMEQAFLHGASLVFVDPNPKNHKALALYRRLGFMEKPLPDYLAAEATDFLPIYMEKQSEH